MTRQASGSPLLASPQGGVAAPINKMARSLRSLGAAGEVRILLQQWFELRAAPNLR
jgi:hypothetical protein